MCSGYESIRNYVAEKRTELSGGAFVKCRARNLLAARSAYYPRLETLRDLIGSQHLKAVARPTVPNAARSCVQSHEKRSLRMRNVFGSINASWTWIRFTKPMISRLSPICKVPHSWHSRLAGDSAIRGGRTTEDGHAVSPAISSSLMP